MVLKQVPSHRSGKIGGQPAGSVSIVTTEVTVASNSGDLDGGDELTEGIVDLTIDDRFDVGVDVREIDDHNAGAQTLNPVPFRV